MLSAKLILRDNNKTSQPWLEAAAEGSVKREEEAIPGESPGRLISD